MNDSDLLRYAAQILLPQIGIDGQNKLLNSTLLLVGIGGLGAPSALYLAAAGVGHLIIADFDVVELSNLQRQIAHHTADIGRLKVTSAQAKMHAINPNIKITALQKLDEKALDFWTNHADAVLDGTDNFTTRFQINRACVRHQTPLISAAVVRFEGQLSVFKGYQKRQPCYQCLYPENGAEDTTCTTNGILAPVAGVMGTLQALQAIKVLLNLGEQLLGELLLVDALDLSFRKIKISKDSRCKICG